jgi:cell division GTPase FtsZ
MTVKHYKESLDKEEIVDDVTATEKTVIEVTEEQLDEERVAALKARMKEKQKGEEVPPKIVEDKTRSIRFGVIGSGQAGSRLAESFYKLGYDACAINTASQDLAHIDLPESNKLHMDYGLGGSAKELDIGRTAAEAHRNEINELIHSRLGEAQLLLFCTSLGGGSGAGSVETVIDLLAKTERPIAVITVLPQTSDDAQTKDNSLRTLSKLSKMVQNRVIDNLIVVDNAKIETIYKDVGQLNFFPVSNQAIVDPINQFNVLSCKSSPVKPLDPTEFGKIFTDGQGLTVYGMVTVSDYEDQTALAEAVIDGVADPEKNSLLASGFNLRQARYAGVIFAASEEVWNKIPSASVNYAMTIIDEACDNPLGTYKGVYAIDTDEDAVKVYSMFSGLALPEERIAQLKEEAKSRMAQAEKKDQERNLSLKLDPGEQAVTAAQAVRKEISKKKSSFVGKLHKRAIIDRRKV